MGQGHVVAGQSVGVEGVDLAAVVINFGGETREGQLYRVEVPADGVREKGGAEVLAPGKIIDGRAVKEDGGAVHGQRGGNGRKAG